MKTIYYNIIISRTNSKEIISSYDFENSESEGFLKVNIDKANLKIDGEGVLTLDFIRLCNEGSDLILKYFVPSNNFKHMVLDSNLQFKGGLPLNFEAVSEDYCISVLTTRTINDPNEISNCDRILEEFKNSKMFLAKR